MKIIFLRHGESKANVHGAFYDDPEMNFLSLRGAKQADLASYTIAELASDGIDHVYTSDIVRSKQTASIVMQSLNDWQRPYHRDARLNEWCWGAPSTMNWYDWEPESVFRARSRIFFRDCLVPLWDTDETVLIVSHYYSMVGLFDEIAIHQGLVSDYAPLDVHGFVSIPNAIPYYFDNATMDEPEMIQPGHPMGHR